MKKMNKKGDMGIGTLIIFIALLLVAAVAAGVLIQTSGSLQERALMTGDQAKGQIATNIRVVEVSSTDGSDGDLEYFEEIIKLSPGSNAIKLGQALLTMNTYDSTAVLQYRGTSGIYEDNLSSGFYTLALNETLGTITNLSNTSLAEDYDSDSAVDKAILRAGYIYMYFSDGNEYNISNFNCTGSSHAVSGTYTITDSDEISSVIVSGTCGSDSTSGATVVVTSKESGEGFFTVEYLQRGTNPVDGNLQTGDVAKIYYAAPRSVNEDEDIRLNFIPKIGTPTLTQFITPEVISTERVYLYP